MATLGDLMIKLGVDSSGVGKGMDEANKSIKIGALAIGGAALAAGKALYNIGSTFDDVSDTIRTTTGASGASLDALVGSAKKVGSQVPASFQEIGDTIAQVNQRLGLTGPTLEKVSSQFLNLGHITGETINISNVTGALNAFGVKGAAVSTTLDDLFNISKSTGVGVNELGTGLQKNGKTLQAFGFSASQGAALLGTMSKAGISGDKAVGSLSKAMVGFAKAGKSPQQGLADTIKQIQTLTAAGDKTGATTLAAKVFGAKGATPFLSAINAGSLSIAGLNKIVKGNGDTINGVAGDTADFAEAWQLFKNRAMLALEPVATRVFSVLTKGMNWVSDNGIPIMQAIAEKVRQFQTPLEVVGAILTAVLIPRMVVWAATSVVAFAVNIAGWIKTQAQATLSAARIAAAWIISMGPIALVIAAVVGLTYVIVKNFDKIKGAISTAFNWVKSHWPLILAILTGPFGLAVLVITKNWSKITGVVKSVFNTVVSFLKGLPGKMVSIGSDIVQGVINGIKSKAGDVASTVKDMAENAIKAPFKKIMGIFSPSKVFYGYGVNTGQGFIDGINKISPQVGDAMQAVVGKALDALNSAKDLKASLKSAFTLDFSVPDPETGGGFIDSLNKQVAAAKQFTATMASLAKQGLNKNVLDYFASQGPGSLAQLSQINASNIGQVNSDYKAITKTGNNFGNSEVLRQTGIDLTKAQPVKVVLDIAGGDKDLQNLIKKWVRLDGGGDVQVAFGKKK